MFCLETIKKINANACWRARHKQPERLALMDTGITTEREPIMCPLCGLDVDDICCEHTESAWASYHKNLCG